MNPPVLTEPCEMNTDNEERLPWLEVTDAGSLTIHYQRLLRQAVPVLQSPEDYPEAYRTALVHKITLSLAALPDEENERSYEPGCVLNEDDEEGIW